MWTSSHVLRYQPALMSKHHVYNKLRREGCFTSLLLLLHFRIKDLKFRGTLASSELPQVRPRSNWPNSSTISHALPRRSRNTSPRASSRRHRPGRPKGTWPDGLTAAPRIWTPYQRPKQTRARRQRNLTSAQQSNQLRHGPASHDHPHRNLLLLRAKGQA